MFTVSAVDKAGAIRTAHYGEVDAAESKWQEEVLHIQAGNIVRVGLEETLVDGSIKPLKAAMSQYKQEADLFVASIRAKRTH